MLRFPRREFCPRFGKLLRVQKMKSGIQFRNISERWSRSRRAYRANWLTAARLRRWIIDDMVSLRFTGLII